MSKRTFSRLLVTGGSGFMGSSFIRTLFKEKEFERIVNLDLLTYAVNDKALKGVENSPRYHFIQGNICDADMLEKLIMDHEIDLIVNFAAETHVDRSIVSPSEFMDSNIRGVFTLLELVRKFPHIHFHQVSTDEVFGSLGDDGVFTDDSPYRPNSPYSASKAAGDHLVRAYHQTYGLNVTLSRSSNNYGPFQNPEKFIPLMITNALQGKTLPVYGNGKNVRDWIYVDDHARAVLKIIEKGEVGGFYNIAGKKEVRNIDLLHHILEVIADLMGKSYDELALLIIYVQDRQGHDFRYALDSSKLEALGFSPQISLNEGLIHTVRFFRKALLQKIS